MMKLGFISLYLKLLALYSLGLNYMHIFTLLYYPKFLQDFILSALDMVAEASITVTKKLFFASFFSPLQTHSLVWCQSPACALKFHMVLNEAEMLPVSATKAGKKLGMLSCLDVPSKIASSFHISAYLQISG